ncbi:UNVERIFIED_CONTAM: hypothetical protein Sradi_7082600, partial [Sesamum radiatum]
MEDNSVKQAKPQAKEKRTKVTVLLGPFLKGTQGIQGALWEELKRLSLNKVPWIVGGDFNTMLHTQKIEKELSAAWALIEDFNDMVLDSGLTDAGFEGEPFAWSNKRGYGMYRLQHKLYRLKNNLKQWNMDIFGNAFSLVDQAKAAANEVEKQFDRLPSKANLINLNKQNAALVQALNLESEFWREKPNCKWLEAGERNIKFFHSSVKKK